MTTVRQASETDVGDGVKQRRHALGGDEHIPVAGENKRRRLDEAKLLFDVEFLDQAKAMRHDALIGLPNLPGHKLEQRIVLLPTAEEQVEKLIDERAILGQRKPGQDRTGDLLDQSPFIASTDT